MVYKTTISYYNCKPEARRTKTMIGKRLKLARAAAGLSLRELAERIGNRVSAQQIGKYERDEDVPSSGVLIALGHALGVSVDYLVGDQ
jgi:transcriptional regulator with XRE-family HTH domain